MRGVQQQPKSAHEVVCDPRPVQPRQSLNGPRLFQAYKLTDQGLWSAYVSQVQVSCSTHLSFVWSSPTPELLDEEENEEPPLPLLLETTFLLLAWGSLLAPP